MHSWFRKKEIKNPIKPLPRETITIIDNLDIPEPYVLQTQVMADATGHIKLLNKLITDTLYIRSRNGKYTAFDNVFKFKFTLNLIRYDKLASVIAVAEYMNVIVKQWERKGYSMIFAINKPYVTYDDIYLTITITWNKNPY